MFIDLSQVKIPKEAVFSLLDGRIARYNIREIRHILHYLRRGVAETLVLRVFFMPIPR